MLRLPDWLRPRARRLARDAVVGSPAEGGAAVRPVSGFVSATNIGTRVIVIVRPHLRSPDCLIVTGYQDFFSSLAVLMREVPELALDDGPRIRIAFGMDTGLSAGLPGRGRRAPEAAKRHILGRHGLALEDLADLHAITAAEAIRAGRIDLRIYDPDSAAVEAGLPPGRRLHAKLGASARGAITGSANFSRSGLYRNIEHADAAVRLDDATTAAVAKDRQRVAETIWSASTDWNTEALEILEALLRPVTTADAVARTIHEQKGFTPWRVDALGEVAGRPPMPHQADLVYEASAIAYEHGFAFLEAPTGSGKTDIGKYLGQTLGTSFGAIFGHDNTGRAPRGGALAIVPPRVVPGWKRPRPPILSVEPNTQIAPGRGPVATRRRGWSGGAGGRPHPVRCPYHRREPYRHAGIHGDYEAGQGHRAGTAFLECLPVGDASRQPRHRLARHLHEQRASIFMSPDWLEEMAELFRPETDLATIMSEDGDAVSLSPEERKRFVDMLSPFIATRRRACIGESGDRHTAKGRRSYPPFRIHRRPASLSLAKRQRASMIEIEAQLSALEPGRALISSTMNRLGRRQDRFLKEVSFPARNLLNILRSNSAQAL